VIIAIPTRGRIGTQRTLRLLPAEWKELIHVWAPAEEIPLHRAQPYAAKVGQWHADRYPGIAGAWQAQLEYCVENGVGWLWVLEDDLSRFNKWADLSVHRQLPATAEEVAGRILDFTEEANVGFIGVLNRGFSSKRFPRSIEYGGRMHGSRPLH
jgi:hypothetical protein